MPLPAKLSLCLLWSTPHLFATLLPRLISSPQCSCLSFCCSWDYKLVPPDHVITARQPSTPHPQPSQHCTAAQHPPTISALHGSPATDLSSFYREGKQLVQAHWLCPHGSGPYPCLCRKERRNLGTSGTSLTLGEGITRKPNPW